MKQLITIQDLDNWEACCREPGECYSDENLAILLGGRPGWVPVEILRDKRIRAADRLWAVLRPEVVGEVIYQRFGHICADRVVEKYCLHCGASTVGDWARKWLDGTDRSCVGAWAAVKAAREAAEAEVTTAAWAAARAAEAAEAAEGAWAAADAAEALGSERQWQCEKLIELIEEETK